MAPPEVNKFYRQVSFLTSAQKVTQLPQDTGIEVAFMGRSNAGKSSALNTLTDQKKLARISKTPGRTQLLNVFALDENRRLVDLPGYGYAKVNIKVKEAWEKNIDEYLTDRASLKGVVFIMDVRHPLQEFDRQMLDWAMQSQLKIHILLTKADKLNKNPAKNVLLEVRQYIKAQDSLFSAQLFSSLDKTGLAELCDKLNEWFGLDVGLL